MLAQIYLGALVAGLRAGLIYNTWPLIEGTFIPNAAKLWSEHPWWRNLFDNTLTVQFAHRMMAYTLWVLALVWAVHVTRHVIDRGVRLFAYKLAGAVTIQAALGIVTLVHEVPIGFALAHQAMAIVVLTLVTLQAAWLRPQAARLDVTATAEQVT